MQLKNLIEFRSDLFFEGAVQADWFYSKEKADLVANSFVFHGPKYFGVTSSDVSDNRLIDTASFLKKIYNNLYNTTEETNPFTLAIAGYGTGKSHLAVSLAKYFSNLSDDEDSLRKISSNLKMADNDVYLNTNMKQKKKNFVIVLNGMKDFNLNYEILKSVKLSLKLHGYSNSFLKGLSKAHEVALGFVERNFETQPLFLEKCKKNKMIFSNEKELKEIILNEIHDEEIFEIVDSIYENINGHKIRWDEGISANKVLEKVEEELCGVRGEFNKILIIFDEFGRFLEYASDSPQKAGDSALQQIFEAIQNTDKNIMFIGTIQSDLKSYLTRVDKTSNISRYIGRYEVSDRVYLSSNLETIFASLIEKKDNVVFESLIGEKIDKTENSYHRNVHNNLKRWIPESNLKGVWNSWEKYSQVILKGIYPFHPLSTWLLSSLSNWLQNRSSLTLINRKIKEYHSLEIDEFGKLPFILPVSLIDGDLFSELLTAEEEGRQRSQYCIVYNNILKKHGDKLSQNEKNILTSNLILRICRFKTFSKEDILNAMSILSGLNEVFCLESLGILETEYGILQYDDISNCFDFVGDAVGQADFRRFFKKKSQNTKLNYDLLEANSVKLENLGEILEVETNFGKANNISTNEWKYKGELLITDILTESNFETFKKSFQKATQPDQVKGKLLWFYINKDSSNIAIDNLKRYSKLYFNNLPITSMIINDTENKLFDAIKELLTINSLNDTEKKEYNQFIVEFKNKIETRIKEIFYELKFEKLGIIDSKISTVTTGRLSKYLDVQLKKIYPEIIPFPFDSFTNKQLNRPRKMLLEIAQKILYSSGKEIDIRTAGVEVRNRFESVLINSWKCVDEKTLKLVHPKNSKVSNIYKFIDKELEKNDEKIYIRKLIKSLLKPPFGLNDYSASLVLFSYISNREFEIRIKLEEKFYNITNWSEKIIRSDGKDLDFKTLENSEINIVDTGEEDTKVRKIIGEIRSNSDIERVGYLSIELEKLLSVISVEGDLRDLVEVALSRLEYGKELFTNYKKNIASMEYSLEEAIEKPDKSIEILIREIKKIEKDNRDLPSNYTYTESQFSKFLEVEFTAKKLIINKFDKWLEKVNCREIGKLNSFQSKNKNLGMDLKKIGYIEFQQKLISRVNFVMKNTEKIREYQHLKENIDNYKAESIVSSYTKYVELKSLEKKGKIYLEQLKINSGIYEEDKIDLEKLLNKKIKEIKQYLSLIENEMANVNNLIDEAETFNDLLEVLDKITAIKTRGLDDEEIEEFNYMGNFIINFKNSLLNLSSEEDPSNIFENKKELLKEAIDDEYGVDLTKVLDNYTDSLLCILNKKSEKWSENYLKINVLNMSDLDLKRWLKDTEVIPKFLSENTIIDFERLKSEIFDKISEDKIKYIITLLEELTDQEKNKIKAILN
ncbi:MAG: hypothetical protein B6I28_00330 [Fusobacteriia bacterium 4572_132]|nr:MAG: hypothetical protein B6I28_00330 [Fusobacteriia bacterium 4572_132]